MDFAIHHMLRTTARRFPEKEALVHGKQRLTYTEVYRRTLGLAAGLQEVGIRRGERVGIYLDPSIAQALSIFSISRAAGVYVPINSVLFPQQVAHIVRDCEMSALITTRNKLASLTQAVQDIRSLRFVILVDDEEESPTVLPSYNFDSLCRLEPPSYWPDVAIDKDLAAILYTSGSTGKPKGVMLSHANVVSGASIVSDYLAITDADRILAVLPFSFDAGMNQLTTAFQQGATLVLIRFVFAREIVQALLAERITGLAGVPTVWSLLAQPNSGLQKHKFPHLRYITNTGGAMPQTLLSTLREALPTTQIVLMYGLTEAFRSTYLPPAELDRRPTSMGKAIPNCEILVINESGQLCQPGEVGELVHRGPTVSMGYWGNPEATRKVLRPNPVSPPQLCDNETVCYSGDLVRMDEDGFLYYVGRRDTMIKSSGYRISPTEVEEALFRSGKLRQVAVIGVPDGILGQVIKAFVVAREGEAVDCQNLLDFCAENLPRYMVPKTLEVLDELPKTSSGKVDYPALRRREGL